MLRSWTCSSIYLCLFWDLSPDPLPVLLTVLSTVFRRRAETAFVRLTGHLTEMVLSSCFFQQLGHLYQFKWHTFQLPLKCCSRTSLQPLLSLRYEELWPCPSSSYCFSTIISWLQAELWLVQRSRWGPSCCFHLQRLYCSSIVDDRSQPLKHCLGR
jgi:hypothetical protein